jgi:hypothetical protein
MSRSPSAISARFSIASRPSTIRRRLESVPRVAA